MLAKESFQFLFFISKVFDVWKIFIHSIYHLFNPERRWKTLNISQKDTCEMEAYKSHRDLQAKHKYKQSNSSIQEVAKFIEEKQTSQN